MTNVGFDLLTDDHVREYSVISNNHTDQIVINDQLIQKFLHKKTPKFKIWGKLGNVNSYSFS